MGGDLHWNKFLYGGQWSPHYNKMPPESHGALLLIQPERILGNEYTIRSDVWSTGITLLELVQQRFPFPNDAPPIELIMHITAGDVRSLFSRSCTSD